MDRNSDYRGRENPSEIPGGVTSYARSRSPMQHQHPDPRSADPYDQWQRVGPDRGPPEPRSSSDFRDFPSSTHNRSPPRPHRRSRSPGFEPRMRSRSPMQHLQPDLRSADHYDQWQRVEPDRGPPEPRSSSDFRLPPRPHQRSRSPGFEPRTEMQHLHPDPRSADPYDNRNQGVCTLG